MLNLEVEIEAFVRMNHIVGIDEIVTNLNSSHSQVYRALVDMERKRLVTVIRNTVALPNGETVTSIYVTEPD